MGGFVWQCPKPKGRFLPALGAYLLAALMPLLAACGGTDLVVIATIGNYHPFDFINEEGEIDGLERELGDELCRRAGLVCAWALNDWETMIPDLVAEEFDAILSGMSITPKREELIDFTEAYYPPTPSVYVARAGEGGAAARGTIGVTDNTIYSDHLTALGVPFVPIDISRDAVDAVLTDEVDAVLVDHGYGVEKLAEFDGRLAIVGPSVPLDRGLGIGVRKGSGLKGRLDEALASMKADGALNALILKWVGEDGSTFE
ncbi:MAG: transporter substrate-binding domain-containing protein [Chloroflexi bacterium]|nr:transporter substrate-binding domain-containing protein [Chloroflexota bacterium]